MSAKKKYNWTIQISVLPSIEEFEISMQNGSDLEEKDIVKSLKDKVIEFTDIKLTKEDLDDLINKATEDINYFKLDLPDNNSVVKIYLPRELITSITVLKTKRKSAYNRKILKEATDIIKRCTQE